MKKYKLIAAFFLLISTTAFADYSQWIYDPGAKTLTSDDFSNDGTTVVGWQFVKVTCDGAMLTISRLVANDGVHIVPSEASPLDFSKPIKDAEGNEYFLKSFATGNPDRNLLNDINNSIEKSKMVTEMILPKTFVSADPGTFQFFLNVTFFDFLGDLKSINARMFYKANNCKIIRFHYFPPKPTSNSKYTFLECGYNGKASNSYQYRYRLEYPKFLEDAWLNTVYKEGDVYYARYGLKFDGTDSNVDLNVLPESKAKTRYAATFGDEPAGWAWLNWNGSLPTGKMGLEPFDEENPTDRVVLGVMGLPYDISQSALEVKDYGYGYHEFALEEGSSMTLPLERPKRVVKVGEQYYTCVGYKLFKDSNAVDFGNDVNNPNQVIPYDQTVTVGPGNYGLTWIWEEGQPGFKIMVR